MITKANCIGAMWTQNYCLNPGKFMVFLNPMVGINKKVQQLNKNKVIKDSDPAGTKFCVTQKVRNSIKLIHW